MDLGATVCTPKSPSCLLCPLTEFCKARARGIAADLPRKEKKKPKPERRGVAFVLIRPDGAALVERRPAKIMLGGLLGFPGTPWWDRAGWEAALAAPQRYAPAAAGWEEAGTVSHVFTHFRLELDVRRARGEAAGEWLDPSRTDELPTLMRKALERAAA